MKRKRDIFLIAIGIFITIVLTSFLNLSNWDLIVGWINLDAVWIKVDSILGILFVIALTYFALKYVFKEVNKIDKALDRKDRRKFNKMANDVIKKALANIKDRQGK